MTIVEFRYNEHVPVTETRLADLDGNCNDVSFELPSHRSQPLSLFFFFFFLILFSCIVFDITLFSENLPNACSSLSYNHGYFQITSITL